MRGPLKALEVLEIPGVVTTITAAEAHKLAWILGAHSLGRSVKFVITGLSHGLQ